MRARPASPQSTGEPAWKIEDEDEASFLYHPTCVEMLESIIPDRGAMLNAIIDSLMWQCDEVGMGNVERTAMGLDEWQVQWTTTDLIRRANCPRLTSAPDAARLVHAWMTCASGSLYGLGTVGVTPHAGGGPPPATIADGRWVTHLHPIWSVNALVYWGRREERPPDAYVLSPSETIRRNCRHRRTVRASWEVSGDDL